MFFSRVLGSMNGLRGSVFCWRLERGSATLRNDRMILIPHLKALSLNEKIPGENAKFLLIRFYPLNFQLKFTGLTI